MENINYKVEALPQIPQELIERCDQLSTDLECTMFIFDNHLNNNLSKLIGLNKDEERDLTISEILEMEEDFAIDDISGFQKLPSRFAYYDTEIRLCGRYERLNYVIDYIKLLGFEPSITNFGPEFEQSFILTLGNKCMTLRLTPNLFVSYFNSENGFSSKSFFNKKLIMEWLLSFDKEHYTIIIRDRLIEALLDE